MTLQQFDGERVVDIHYHKGEHVSTRCVNEGGCKQLKTSYNGEAQTQKKGKCATIGNPTLERLRGLVLTSWPVQLQRISNMHIGKGYDSSAS